MMRSRSNHRVWPALAVVFWTCATTAPVQAAPQTNVVGEAREPWSAYISEASQRFGVPEPWIRSVMRVESGGDAHAVSPKGAMGLMQIMPETWTELRVRYGLGADPYDPRDNILAGAAYLREMRDRYGYPVLFAAYNAGPQRVDEYLSDGRSLPAETQAYLAAFGHADVTRARSPGAASTVSLFVDLHGDSGSAAFQLPSAGSLFVPLSSAQGRRP
jgi:soluble lytic murein transglycosylase-like protein